MELGEPFKQTLVIQPGGDGSFIVMARKVENNLSHEIKFGFTTIDDLLIWMAKHGTKACVTELKEGDMVTWEEGPAVKTGPATYGYQKSGIVAGSGALCGMDALNGLKRTTAAEIIREREACNAAIVEAAAARNGKTLAERVEAAEKAWSDADRPTNDAA